MKITILGWYGHNNLGDEMMLEGFKALLNKVFDNPEITPMTDVKDRKYQLVSLSDINDSDLFILGGGELINQNRLFLNVPHWIQAVIVPKVILGCGLNVEEYDYLDEHVKEDLRSFDYIGVRDITSYRMLAEDWSLISKLGQFFDPCYQLTLPDMKTVRKDKKVGIIIPTDRFTNEFDNGIDIYDTVTSTSYQLKQMINIYDISRLDFVVFGGDDNNDKETCERLAEKLGYHYNIIRPNSVKETLDIINNGDIIFTYRLHGLFASDMLHKQYHYIKYHRKLDRNHYTLSYYPPDKIREIQLNEMERVKQIME